MLFEHRQDIEKKKKEKGAFHENIKGIIGKAPRMYSSTCISCERYRPFFFSDVYMLIKTQKVSTHSRKKKYPQSEEGFVPPDHINYFGPAQMLSWCVS